MTRKEKIYAFMNSELYVPLLEKELIAVLDVPECDTEEFSKLLDELVKEGFVIKSRKGRYLISGETALMTGKYSGHERGFGFVSIEGRDDDVFITNENSGGAMNGDTVVLKITTKKTDLRREEGEIVNVLSHANNKVICTFRQNPKKTCAVADNKRIWQYIKINPAHTLGAQNSQKVVVEITKYPKGNSDAEGKVVEILGFANSPETSMLCVLRTFGIPEKFPDKVTEELNSIAETISEQDLIGRRDMRDTPIITIDGEDARDLDDAITIKKAENGNYILGVHIADVTNYVKEGSEILNEAIKRGTSVYLAGGVIPMLPPKLSNGVCSLNPQQDRLTLSIDMEINEMGEIVNHDIYKGVIKTAHRMTYTGVTAILNGNKKLRSEYSDVVPMLMEMKKLAKILHHKRRKEGSIDFDFPEAKLVYDEDGRVTQIYKYEYTIANVIIEEFMLAANKTVAERYFWLNMPFVYRIHEKPSDEKITELKRLLSIFNQKIKGNTDEIHPKALQQVLDNIKGEPYERIIETVMLRSMMKAKYSTENLGHFGLSAKYYCHFTSPIRRLADLAIHRIIKETIDGKITDKTADKYMSFASIAAQNASDCEVLAEEAERLSKRLKIAEYMYNFIGEEVEGIICSIVSSGFYVELENTVEGRVSLADLEDDYYNFIPSNYSLVGEHTGKTYHIGDKIQVIIAQANRTTGDIDFVPIKE